MMSRYTEGQVNIFWGWKVYMFAERQVGVFGHMVYSGVGIEK